MKFFTPILFSIMFLLSVGIQAQDKGYAISIGQESETDSSRVDATLNVFEKDLKQPFMIKLKVTSTDASETYLEYVAGEELLNGAVVDSLNVFEVSPLAFTIHMKEIKKGPALVELMIFQKEGEFILIKEKEEL